ncbi:MAG: maltose/maltodextrin ABC transporter substrate-binding protein MalE [Kiritimatiellia bacterium]|jgi:maltose/maltodextrin transport system substrate-binding protein|nr:maltose/maltodextrin ABC transporter substrate-binding protein MalE [Kiritimatiellia bacterium]
MALPAQAWDADRLLIWINGDKGYRGIEEIGQIFEHHTGIPVVVEHPEGATDKFFHAAKSGKGPDIMIWAHDRLGEWADAGLLLPIDPDPAILPRLFPKALEAFTHRGRLWGYPLAMESTGLIYNKALIAEHDIPRTLADCARLAPGLKAQGAQVIMWDYNNTYFTFGLLASAGGYVFGRHDDGSWDVRDVGVNHPAAVRAMDDVVGLIREGILPSSLSYSIAESHMNQGQLAMFISGPFAWENLKKSGIDFGVTTLPGVDGQPGRPFVGVVGAVFNRSSPNLDLAQEFLEHYLLTPSGLDAMDRHVPLGVPALINAYNARASDPLMAGSMANIEAGVLMPGIPQMGVFWSAMESALSTITSQRATPQAALDNARERMLRAP